MDFEWTDYDRAALESLFFLGHTPGQEARPIIYPKKADDRGDVPTPVELTG